MSNKTFIIAEAGSNHNGDFETAKKLIDVAIAAEANAVKFQSFRADKLFSTKAGKVNNFDVFELFRPRETPHAWNRDLKLYCDDQGIEFMSTPFDEEAVDLLYEIGVSRFKVAGFESTDLRFIKYVASTRLPIIISAGLECGKEMISQIITTCHGVGCEDITILHCNSAYPTPQSEINLDTIKFLSDEFNGQIRIGLSDHTLSSITPALAVCHGATCVEKHYTLSKTMEGPDHSFAVEPTQLKEMVKYIRLAEVSGGLKLGITDSEQESIQGRRSIVLKRNVSVGEGLTADTLTTKRPYYEGCIKAEKFFDLIESNKCFLLNLEQDEFLKDEHFK